MNQASTKPKRPFILKVLVFSLVFISFIGWLRVQQSLYQWAWLVRFQIYPGPLYTVASGAVVGISSLVGAMALWWYLSWGIWFGRILIGLLTLGWWLDYLVFAQATTAWTNLPFRVLLSILYLTFAYLTLYLVPRKIEKRRNE